MDIVKILGSLKEKVLDATNFELLKSAYELQEENIQQLKSNNEALRDANNLLKDEGHRLSEENATLHKQLKTLRAKLAEYEEIEPSLSLSPVAEAILELFLKEDTTDMYDSDMFERIDYGKIETQAALDELVANDLLDTASYDPAGTNYVLTEEGAKLLANRSASQ